MNQKLLYLSLFLFVGLWACQDNWDKHYLLGDDGTQNMTTITIWEYISQQPKYSEFVDLAKSTGVDSILMKEQQMTLWLPDSESMATMIGLRTEEQAVLLKNHINYVALRTNRFADGEQVKTLANKNVYLAGSSDAWTIGGQVIVPDIAHCSNGVIHEVKGVLVPKKNIFEYIAGLGDDYSTVRDTILNSCVKTFRPELSFPLGVDEVGNTVYDSVFVYESKLLAPGDIREENEELTLFLPDNEKIRAVYEEVKTFYPELGAKDSLLINNWIFRALIYKGKIVDYTAKKSIKSTFGLEWRTDIQKVNSAKRVDMSNGFIYPIDYFRIPHFLFLTKVESWPIYEKELKGQAPELVDQYFLAENYELRDPRWIADASKGIPYYRLENSKLKDDQILALEWTSIDKNRFGDVVAVPLVPGRYKLSVQFRGYNTGKARMSVNGLLLTNSDGSEISSFGMSDSRFDNKVGELGYITIPESAGVKPVRIRIESGASICSGHTKRIAVSHVIFEPDGDNY